MRNITMVVVKRQGTRNSVASCADSGTHMEAGSPVNQSLYQTYHNRSLSPGNFSLSYRGYDNTRFPCLNISSIYAPGHILKFRQRNHNDKQFSVPRACIICIYKVIFNQEN